MMKKATYIFLTAAALLAVACQSEILPEGEVPGGESILCFQPALGGAIGTKSNVDNGSLTDSDSATPSTVAELVATDGSISIPLTCTVSDGIGEPAAPQTKGSQMNTSGDWDALGEYIDKFYVAAWKGSTSFIPAHTEVTKGTPLWKTSTDYRWEATEDATFYAYANLPESGATVTPTSGAQLLNYLAVPSSTSAQTDILMGYYSGKPKYDATLHKGGIAEVKFYHPLTAVRFKMGTFIGATSVQFKSISIKNVSSNGIAVMNSTTVAAEDPGLKFNWTPPASTQTVTMSPASGETYLSVDANGFIGDAFLLIPQTMTNSAPVTIRVVVDLDGTEKKFDAKLTDNSWEAGKTNVYTLGYLNIPDGALPGAFSVSQTKKVYFSKGLLQATVDASGIPVAWKFAPNQYYYIGEGGANKTIGTAGGDVDGFGWSTDGSGATDGYKPWGINTSKENSDYLGNFVDWGIAYCEANGVTPNTTWRTLSGDEWRFLLSYKSNAYDPNNILRAGLHAKGVTVVGVTNCVVVYPDDYDKSNVVSDGDTTSYDTAEEWAVAERNGAVCLLAAGYRFISAHMNNGGVYIWSSAQSSDTQALQMINYSTQFPTSACDRRYGRTVRLVTDAN